MRKTQSGPIIHEGGNAQSVPATMSAGGGIATGIQSKAWPAELSRLSSGFLHSGSKRPARGVDIANSVCASPRNTCAALGISGPHSAVQNGGLIETTQGARVTLSRSFPKNTSTTDPMP